MRRTYTCRCQFPGDAMPATDPAVRYRFTRFELQPDERVLLEAGAPVDVGPRAFDLLVALAEHAGHLVTKAKLLERVWPKVIVEEAALQMQISSLRKILGRDAIATVTGRGYRFVLPVTCVGASVDSAAALPKHNLPRSLTSFVGREQQISELQSLLGRNRLITLTGAGGCGKTRLAMQTVAGLVPAYPDGVWLVELAALTDPALVPHSVARVFGLKEQPGKALTQTITEYLAERRLLLVLDNAEHLLEACARLADTVLHGCENVSALVTSRERLGIAGELTYRVPPLSLLDAGRRVTPAGISACESARLLIERVHLQLPHFVVTAQNAPVLASICHRLDGIPLAIELAAVRLRAMPVEELGRRLDQRFELLTGGSRTALARHQTLRTLIDWSFDVLNDAEQALLCRASVFSGGWTMEAAERVCVGDAVDAGSLVDVLTSLVDKNLVLAQAQHGAIRYGLLETVRHYAGDRLRERGDDTNLRRRHLDYMLALAQEAEPRLIGEEPHAWFERLEAEHDNFRTALAWSIAPDGSAVDGLRLASLMGRFWGERGHLAEGRRWLSSLIAAVPAGRADAARANALRQEGILARAQADCPAARKLLGEALAIFRTLGDRRGVGQTLNSLASTAIDEGDFPLAQLLLEESLAITRELGDQRWTGVVLANLGVVAMQVGEGSAARGLFEESLAIQRTVGDRGANAIATHNLGLLLREQGDYVRAEALLKESLFTWHARGNHAYIASSLEGLAALALVLGQPIRAARLWGRAARTRDETGAALPQWVRSRFNQDVAAARIAVGDDVAFDRAWAEGRDMTQEHVTKYLLDFGAIG